MRRPDHEINAIRTLCKLGFCCRSVGDVYGIRTQAVYNITRLIAFADVEYVAHRPLLSFESAAKLSLRHALNDEQRAALDDYHRTLQSFYDAEAAERKQSPPQLPPWILKTKKTKYTNVGDIKALAALGLSPRSLANMFGMTEKTVYFMAVSYNGEYSDIPASATLPRLTPDQAKTLLSIPAKISTPEQAYALADWLRSLDAAGAEVQPTTVQP